MLAAPSTKKRGRPPEGNVDQINIRDTGGGNSSSYLAARLKRDHPALAAEVEVGHSTATPPFATGDDNISIA
jgi:hypothetical protein